MLHQNYGPRRSKRSLPSSNATKRSKFNIHERHKSQYTTLQKWWKQFGILARKRKRKKNSFLLLLVPILRQKEKSMRNFSSSYFSEFSLFFFTHSHSLSPQYFAFFISYCFPTYSNKENLFPFSFSLMFFAKPIIGKITNFLYYFFLTSFVLLLFLSMTSKHSPSSPCLVGKQSLKAIHGHIEKGLNQ